MPKLLLLERFIAKVDVRGPDECWLWVGGRTKQGYGGFWAAGRVVLAHRFSYETFVGPIPEGMEIDHVRKRGCLHRACVNPAHLEPVTPQVNSLRGIRCGDETACKAGHPRTPENTYTHRGKNSCRPCRLEASRRARRREAA